MLYNNDNKIKVKMVIIFNSNVKKRALNISVDQKDPRLKVGHKERLVFRCYNRYSEQYHK